jgi:hypothetical protein
MSDENIPILDIKDFTLSQIYLSSALSIFAHRFLSLISLLQSLQIRFKAEGEKLLTDLNLPQHISSP